jgi:hypothetical protein
MDTLVGGGFFGRIGWLFLAVLLLAAGGVWIYQSVVIAPVQRCESAGNWWDPQTGTCGHVIYLPDVTHRRPGSKTPRYPTLPDSAGQAAGGTSGLR